MFLNNISDFCRIKNEAIVTELRRKVRLDPMSVCHIPQALQYLVTTEALLNDSIEVISVLLQ